MVEQDESGSNGYIGGSVGHIGGINGHVWGGGRIYIYISTNVPFLPKFIFHVDVALSNSKFCPKDSDEIAAKRFAARQVGKVAKMLKDAVGDRGHVFGERLVDAASAVLEINRSEEKKKRICTTQF